MLQFGWKRNLNSRFIEPYEVLELIRREVYQLSLLLELSKIHNVFRISMLMKYKFDSSHVIIVQEVETQLDLTFEKEPMKILAQETKKLRNKKVPLVKVLCHNHKVKDAIWESE